jgi:hypothetical protein
MPNYSEIVRTEVDKQRKADCAFFAFPDLGPIPDDIIAQLAVAPPLPADGSTYAGTPDQQALLRWMNRDAYKAEARLNYCKAGT